MIVVDRIEGDVAVLEIAGRRVDVPASELPAGTKEGDRLAFSRLAAEDDADAKARLARLKARTPQGSGPIDL
jgi:L-alanine-DL-glutamate epimerase-like enolase superfamily enzyme